MASTRSKRINGTHGYKKAKGDIQKRGVKVRESKEEDYNEDEDEFDIDKSPEAEEERERFKISYKYAYENYFAATIKNRRTGEVKKQSLGEFHYLMIDFDNLDIIDDVETFSVLPQYLPERDEHGDYRERWLYFRTLADHPEVQDGPIGPVSKRFYETFWQGVILRICGDGRTRCMLAPRNHLKSSVGGYHHTTWRSIREPSERHVIRCVGSNLAKKFLVPIKQQFESNKAFMKLFGHLKSEKRDNAWNTEAIQFNIPPDERRGVDPTIQTAGCETDMTGTHGDNYMLDDIVAKTNSGTPALLEGTRTVVSDVHAQRDEGSTLSVKGTRWDDDDAYSTFVGQPGKNEWSGSLAPDSSFFVATVLDGDESVKVPMMPNGLQITPLGYGKPIWPEGFGMRRIESTRRGIVDDYHWRGQYFNQFIGTSSRTFKREWITELDSVTPKFSGWATPRIARELKLNIFMAADTAGGGANQSGKVDKTAAFVGGQTPDRTEFYLLDGFCEKLPIEQIATGIVDIAIKWNEIAASYKGIFKCVFEKTRYTERLEPMIKDEMKRRGTSKAFSIEEISHQNRHKADRIAVMAQPYQRGQIVWPHALMVTPVTEGMEPYDLRKVLEAEFVAYHPKATEDNLIDAHAYSWEIAFPQEWAPSDASVSEFYPLKVPGAFSRDVALNEVRGEDVRDSGGYDSEHMEPAY